MDEHEFKRRTKQLAIRVIRLSRSKFQSGLKGDSHFLFNIQSYLAQTSPIFSHLSDCHLIWKQKLDPLRLVEALPNTTSGNLIGRQLLRSATSVGANYRAACRAKSEADMIAKLGTVEEEGDETLFWFELLVESGLMPEARLSNLMKETDEIVAMTVASIKTLRKK